MSKVIKFKANQTKNVEEFLDNVKKQVIDEQIDNMMIVFKCNDGTVCTGYTRNLDWGMKQELVSHMQMNIIDDMIRTNYVTPE